MSELSAFLRLGFQHITSPGALDHLLFLLVLVAPYRPRDWRQLLGVVSAFTVGHSVTLALMVTGVLRLSTGVVEFLIPLTIVATGLENLRRNRGGLSSNRRALLAGAFGLIHGAGFATVLREMFAGSLVVPLFGFNLGIELGQLLILSLGLTLTSCMDWLSGARLGLRPRTVLASLVATVWAAVMASQRLPW